MSTPETPKSNPLEVPRITEEDLEAFSGVFLRDFQTDFNAFRRDQPELARWLLTGNIGIDPNRLNEKRAYLAGMIGYHALITTALKVQAFKNELDGTDEKPNPNDDGDDGEDPPLSA